MRRNLPVIRVVDVRAIQMSQIRFAFAGRETTRSILNHLSSFVQVHDRHLRKVIETMLEVEKLESVWAGIAL